MRHSHLGYCLSRHRTANHQDRPGGFTVGAIGTRRRSLDSLPIAIDELNAQGGALARKFELVHRDDGSLPTRGVIAARELIYKEKVAVLFGGLDTPVSLAIVPLANAQKTPFMGPWAAGTKITRNGASPQLRIPSFGS